MKKIVKLGLLTSVLTAWYLTNPIPKNQDEKDYPIPKEISVIETSLHYEEKKVITSDTLQSGEIKKDTTLEKIVKTGEIDFSKEFNLKTERYNLIKKEESKISRAIGWVFSTPSKLLFWDYDIGKGLDSKKSKAVLSILEQNKNLKDLTVRINHNEVIYDCARLFKDEKVKERNSFLARLLIGLPGSIGGELFAELKRGDYYNPMNQTAVLFSNIESISAHELGHHKDFQRFNSDWEYSLTRAIPPVMLYQEWEASQHSLKMLPKEDKFQFNRYLIPAFLTYLLVAYGASKKYLQLFAHKKNGNGKDFRKLKQDEKPKINHLQNFRHFATLNLDLYAGITAYETLEKSGAPDVIKYLSFAGAALGTHFVSNKIMKNIVPYEHEK